jgi:hypothetical protein
MFANTTNSYLIVQFPASNESFQVTESSSYLSIPLFNENRTYLPLLL